MKKLIVVGVNHSGTAVVNTVLDNSKEWDVTIYESNSNCSFLGCGIALWMGNKIDDPSQLFYSSPEALEEKGAKVLMEHQVLNVDFASKKVLIKNLKTGKEFEDKYDKIVISTGSKPIDIKFDGIALSTYDNVMGIKLYQDALHLFKKLKDSSIKHISIIGAGYIGVELAEAAKIHGKEVTLIDQAKELLANHYDPEFSSEISKVMEKAGVKMALNQKVEGVNVTDNVVTSIKTDKGIIKTDLVIVSVGVIMNTK
uniref:NADH oxidase n=1 Tax=Hirondellea gigas TaxID=1518452 RepID=A0A6A7FZS8_9CRUS